MCDWWNRAAVSSKQNTKTAARQESENLNKGRCWLMAAMEMGPTPFPSANQVLSRGLCPESAANCPVAQPGKWRPQAHGLNPEG